MSDVLTTDYLLECGHTDTVPGPAGAATGRAWCCECGMSRTVAGRPAWCRHCGTGPFFWVDSRPDPECCQDCAEARRRLAESYAAKWRADGRTGEPTEDRLRRAFAHCVRPPKEAEYPAIRAAIHESREGRT